MGSPRRAQRAHSTSADALLRPKSALSWAVRAVVMHGAGACVRALPAWVVYLLAAASLCSTTTLLSCFAASRFLVFMLACVVRAFLRDARQCPLGTT